MSDMDRMRLTNDRNAAGRRLDRVQCPHCDMTIVPRLAFYDGTPTKSVCPFCAGIVKDFRKPSAGLKWLGYLLAGLAIVAGFHLTLLLEYGSGEHPGPVVTAVEQNHQD